MKKLKLPVINNFPEENKWLSMDEYIEFVNFIANNFPRDKKRDDADMRVDVPFSIK